MKDGKEYEMTFRELEEWCKKEIKVYDLIGAPGRLRSQLQNDKHYKPIEPGTGTKKYRRWRG